MKNRLSNFVNNINKVLDSVTNAIEDVGSGKISKGSDHEAGKKESIIDKLPMGEGAHKSKTSFTENIKKPVLQETQQIQNPKPSVVQNVQKQEPTEKAEVVVYFMYVCPECRKVFRTKGNDKKVKCSHCDDIYLKDTHVSEVVWRSYSKEERDKIISNIVDEEVFEEVFEEVEEQKEEIKEDKKLERSSYFDDDGLLIGAASTVDSSFDNSYSPVNSGNGSSKGFFSDYEDFNAGSSISRNSTGSYHSSGYSAEKNTKKGSLGKPVVTCVLLLMIGVLVFIGSNVIRVKKQLDEEAYIDEIVNEVMEESQTEEVSHDSHEENTTTDNYSENNYVPEASNYSESNDNTSDLYSVYNDDSNYQNNDSASSYEDTGGYYENDYDTQEEETYDDYEETGTEYYWILNTSKKKIHYPDCYSVDQMSEKNKQISYESVEELQRRGYTTCGNCFR